MDRAGRRDAGPQGHPVGSIRCGSSWRRIRSQSIPPPVVARGRGGAVAAAGSGVRRLNVPPTPFASFPIPGSVPVEFHPAGGGNGVGRLSFDAAKGGTESLFDDVDSTGSDYALSAHSDHRLIYATAPFTDTVQISGTPQGDAPPRAQQAGGEPLGVAGDAAVRLGPARDRRVTWG